MPDHLDSARKAIEDQLSNLREEVKRLEAAASALGGSVVRRGPGRPRGSRRATGAARTRTTRSTTRRAAGGRRAKRSGGKTRADQAHALVKAQPGITIPELATKMKIKQNYLYRVMPALQKDKRVAKRGKGWHPA